ncbi:MAG: hypothetical protein COW48_01710, partial [Hydrogenophilales bacterium CG17_big_fil_post_rev_8_21_14_2_50_63_12]
LRFAHRFSSLMPSRSLIWCLENGVHNSGLLRFWPDPETVPLEFLPAGGTLVVFLSYRFWHEVVPAKRQRLSLTGWFRRR